MQLFTLGLNYQSAPLAVRERIALTGEGLKGALREIARLLGSERVFGCSPVAHLGAGHHVVQGLFASRRADHRGAGRGIVGIRGRVLSGRGSRERPDSGRAHACRMC